MTSSAVICMISGTVRPSAFGCPEIHSQSPFGNNIARLTPREVRTFHDLVFLMREPPPPLHEGRRAIPQVRESVLLGILHKPLLVCELPLRHRARLLIALSLTE